MSNARIGCFNGKTTANVNMIDIFRQAEIQKNRNNTLTFSRMTLKKIGIQCDPGTIIFINGTEIPITNGIFELGFGQIDITSLVFQQSVPVLIYYMF